VSNLLQAQLQRTIQFPTLQSMCTFDGSLAMEPFSLMFQQKILPNTTSNNTLLICWMLQTNQKEKILYPKLTPKAAPFCLNKE
jgi:hypothetical protein